MPKRHFWGPIAKIPGSSGFAVGETDGGGICSGADLRCPQPLADPQQHEIVSPGRPLQQFLVALVEKIAQQENDRPPVQHSIQVVQRIPDAGAALLRLEEQDVAKSGGGDERDPGALAFENGVGRDGRSV